MNRFYKLLLAIVMLMMAAGASALDFSVDYLTYTTTSDGTAVYVS